MALSPYVLGGTLSGLGQGVREGVGTIVARRREAEMDRRAREKEQRDDRRLDLQESRQNDAYNRAIMSQDMEFTSKGGVIEDDPTDNGTARVGFIVGTSTATTQPSEHTGVPMREVGRYKGKVYKLPADGLTPAERLRESGRKSRASTVTGQQYYKPRPDEIEALDDPEIGDDVYKSIRERDWALNPANVNAQARIAGARAGAIAAAREPFEDDRSGRGPDGLTAAQRLAEERAARNMRLTQARGNQTSARQDIRQYQPPEKKEFGYDASAAQFPEEADSLAYVKARRRNFGNRTDARLRAAAAEAEEESVVARADEKAQARRTRELAYQAYKQAFAEAESPEEQREALELYRSIERRSLAIEGRKPTQK